MPCLCPPFSLLRQCHCHNSSKQACRTIFTATDFFTSKVIEAQSEDPTFPIVVSEDGTHALRKRRDGNKPLPLPPHMDPVRRAQRNRWKDRKQSPPDVNELTEFQKGLRDNVYGKCTFLSLRRRTACTKTQVKPAPSQLPSANAASQTRASHPSSSSPSRQHQSRTPTSPMIIQVPRRASRMPSSQSSSSRKPTRTTRSCNPSSHGSSGTSTRFCTGPRSSTPS